MIIKFYYLSNHLLSLSPSGLLLKKMIIIFFIKSKFSPFFKFDKSNFPSINPVINFVLKFILARASLHIRNEPLTGSLRICTCLRGVPLKIPVFIFTLCGLSFPLGEERQAKQEDKNIYFLKTIHD